MWVNFVRVSPTVLDQMKADPSLLEQLVFDPDDVTIDGVDPDTDVTGEDYRTWCAPYFEHLESEEGKERMEADPMYRAVNGPHELAYEFCYGPASYNDPEAVKAIAKDWASWYQPDELEDDERGDVMFFLFFREAAERGQAVICGVS